MKKINNEFNAYITLKEISEIYKIQKATLHYYVLRGLLIPICTVAKTNLYDRKQATKIINEIKKNKRQKLSNIKSKFNIK